MLETVLNEYAQLNDQSVVRLRANDKNLSAAAAGSEKEQAQAPVGYPAAKPCSGSHALMSTSVALFSGFHRHMAGI